MSQVHIATTPHVPLRHGSTFARVALLVYTLLIMYASWYPFSGWTNKGISPFAYLPAPMPRYWTVFDVTTNVLAYIPFGMLLVYALYPLLRGWRALVLATLATVLWSGTMEAVQTYLPTRVSSNLDLATNVFGALLGAAFGLLTSRFFLQESRLLQLRERWFSPEASRGLIVVSTWPLSQVYPQGYVFGHGQLIPILSEWSQEWFGFALEPLAFLWPDVQFGPARFWQAETVITACGLSGAVLTILCLMRKRAPAWVLMLILLGLAIGVKTLATALLFAPENAFVWLTPGARDGLLLGILILISLRYSTVQTQRRSAILLLLIGLVVVNLIPPNPYFVATLQRWVQGKFLSFNGAAQFMSLSWPFLAMWFLLHPVHRRRGGVT